MSAPNKITPIEDITGRDTTRDMSRAVQTAYHDIRTAILKGELKSGDLLPEKDLAEKIGVSRTPVREALNRLRGEGLVVLERYRKNYVAEFGEKDVIEMIELRAMLESYAAGKAADNITQTDIDRLKALMASMEALVYEGQGNLETDFGPLNDQFHHIIYAAADSPRVERFLDTALDLPFDPPQGRLRGQLKSKLEFSCQYHRAIVAALEARDRDRAALHMKSHVLALIPFRT